MTPFPIDPEKDTICDVIHHWANIRPHAEAMIGEGGKTLTYGEFSETIEAMRYSLNRAGFGRGDRIGIVHSGGPDLAATLFGVASAATAVPLNPGYTEAEFTGHLRDRSIDLVLVQKGLDTEVSQSLANLEIPSLEIETAHPAKIGKVLIRSDDLPRTLLQSGRAQSEDLVFVLATSGTTSRSKLVPYRHRHLIYRALAHAELFQLTENDLCLSVRPLHYGSQPLLAAVFLTGGSIALMPSPAMNYSIENFDRLAPTWITGPFTYYQNLYRQNPEILSRINRSCIRFLNVGSGQLPLDTAEGLEKIFEAPLIEGYSSTEMSRIAGNPLPPGRRKRGTVGKPIGCEVCIRSLDGEFLPVGERGEVIVKSPQGLEAYENDPKANAEAFIDGWFRTGDEGFFDEDGYLTLTGRIKEMINRGGEKVSPAEVDAALMSHPEVRDAATFPIPHPTLGEEVAVAVVQSPGAKLTDQALSKYLLQWLSGFKVPRRYYFLDEIPKSDAGKVQRYKLSEALSFNIDLAKSPRSNQDRDPTQLEARLQRLWATALGVSHVGLDDNFFLLGGDSLQAVEMFLQIERELGHRLPRSALFSAGTVSEMARLIENEGPSNCIVPIQKLGTGTPFFCVHDGNGDVLNFRDLAKHMGEARPFYGVQCKGLDGREMPFTDIEDMATHYMSEITKIQPAGPYFIGGYSFGGRVAYVMAQKFLERHEFVHLFLLDTVLRDGEHQKWIWKHWLLRHKQRLKCTPLSDLPAYINMRVENLGSEIRRLMLTSLYGRAVSHYRSNRKPFPRWLYRPIEANHLIRRQTKLTSFSGDAVLFLTDAEPGRSNEKRVAAWRSLVDGKLDIVPISGQHYQIVKEPHVRDLAAKLAKAIQKKRAKER